MVKQYILKDDVYNEIMNSSFADYGDAFLDDDRVTAAKRKTACDLLAAKKFAVCHPRGPLSGPSRRCSSNDTKRELEIKRDKFMRCRNYRYLENQSFCFSKGTTEHLGHVEAEEGVLRAATRCAKTKPRSSNRTTSRSRKSRSRTVSSRLGKGVQRSSRTRGVPGVKVTINKQRR
jgi:hypothetical protein